MRGANSQRDAPSYGFMSTNSPPKLAIMIRARPSLLRLTNPLCFTCRPPAGYIALGAGAPTAADGRRRTAALAERTVISFGSCSIHRKPQPIWTVLAQHQPDLFLWTGDAVYADTTDMRKMAADYAKQQAVPPYAEFLTESTHRRRLG